ncbi:MAG TPA: acylphosphatase [Acidimicrobiales bacterium]|jgi:acylphosphatase|nr:acylphosphatase [Acidimicrobiales bacterium]
MAGYVQGVGYRQSCRRQAVALGVQGWVRNDGDGTVQAALEGEAGAVDQLVAWMRIGPPHARVAKLDVRPETPLGEQGFEVR